MELEGGKKLPCKLAVLADGVFSKTAAKLHKAKLEYMHTAAWRCVFLKYRLKITSWVSQLSPESDFVGSSESSWAYEI